MSKKWDDDELNQQEFTLEEVLAEFGSGASGIPDPGAPLPGPDLPWPEAPRREHHNEPEAELPEETRPEENRPGMDEDTIPFPIRPRCSHDRPVSGTAGNVTQLYVRVPEAADADQTDDGGEPPADPDKVLAFPQPTPGNPVAAGLSALRRKVDDFAGHMFEGERVSEDEEELIPAVDQEEKGPVHAHAHRPKHQMPSAPDTPAVELYQKYTKGLTSQKIRCFLMFCLFAVSLYLTLWGEFHLPLFARLANNAALRGYALAGVHLLAVLLGLDAILKGILGIFRLRMGLDSIAALANLAVLADAILLPGRAEAALRQPYSAAAILALWCVMQGSRNKQRGLRIACRTAASAHEPYLVTRDEGTWNGLDSYAKWSGDVTGFGSQIQAEDGAEHICRLFTPVLLAACLTFSILASVGRGKPENLLWSLSAILTASSALSATLCFGLPWRKLSLRLSQLGAALAGWEGAVNTTGGTYFLIQDTDLFPRRSVTLNGMRIYGQISKEKVMAYTATVLRDAGGGLNLPFQDMMHSEGLLYREGDRLTAYEGGGVSEYIRGDLVLVGSASFMRLMEVDLPQDIHIKNGLYCAINGQLVGLFVIHYRLNSGVEPALDCLIRNRVKPVLTTRDFNLIPSVLRRQFQLPMDRIEFPPVERRRAMSDPERVRERSLTAVLCREGIVPYAEAVVGGRRLRTAVRLSAVLTCIGAAAGCLLAFYLTAIQAYTSLTVLNLLVFLVLWYVPTMLLTHWVNRF